MKLQVIEKPHISVVGSADLETIVRVPSLPLDGMSMLGEDYLIRPGGRAPHISIALADLGCRVFFFSCVGVDSFGGQVIAELHKRRINTDYIERTDHPTGGVHIFTTPQGQQFRVTTPGAGMQMTAAPIRDGMAMVSASRIMVIISDVSDKAVRSAIVMAHKFRVPVLLVAYPSNRLSPQDIRGVDIILADENATAALTGIRPTDMRAAEDALNRLLRLGPGAAIISITGKGAAVSMEMKQSRFIPAPHTARRMGFESDDSFVASLSLALSRGLSLDEAVTFAVAGSSCVEMQSGIHPVFPAPADISIALTPDLD